MSEVVLRVDNLAAHFRTRKPVVKAVDGVTFELRRGETLALVGESGCGKTTVGRSVLGLVPQATGTISVNGVDPGSASRGELKTLRRMAQIIFQDPAGALDPRFTIGRSVQEGLHLHGLGDVEHIDRTVQQMLTRVGLHPGDGDRYPHQLSGGQLQRALIARALVLRPSLLVCDEPVSALDVSIQAQIINLLLDIQRDEGVAYLFISHDLGVVRLLADRIAVMYLGRVVEIGLADRILNEPQHPYTQALVSAIPARHRTIERIILRGQVSSDDALAPGCSFAPRCPQVHSRCLVGEPPLLDVGRHHRSACFLHESTEARSDE